VHDDRSLPLAGTPPDAIPTVAGAVAAAPARLVVRDRVLDALRGLFIVMMVSSHLSDQTLSYTLLHVPRWFSGAEGFVLLSGVVLGIVDRAREQAGEWSASRRILRRAGQIYLVHCALTLSLFVAHEAIGQPPFVPSVAALGGWPATLVAIANLSAQPRFMDTLPLYVLLLAAAPVVLAAARRGGSWVALAGSITLWLIAQGSPGFLVLSDPLFGSDAFRLPAWQLLFVVGLLAGHHRAALTAAIRPYRAAIIAVAATVLSVAFVLAQLERPAIDRSPVEVSLAMLSKPNLGLVRLLTFFSFIVVAYPLVQRIERHPGLGRMLGPLQTIGRRSLASFIVLVVLTVVFIVGGGPTLPTWGQDLFTLGALVVVFLAARSPFCQRVIPN
jgi:hypothetical protein